MERNKRKVMKLKNFLIFDWTHNIPSGWVMLEEFLENLVHLWSEFL